MGTIATILGLLVAVIACWAAYRALFPPKRVLRILVSKGRGVSTSALVSIQSAGRFAVSSDQFEAGAPLVLGLSARVEEVLSTAVTPDRGNVPKVAVADGRISVPPFLLRPGETLSIQSSLDSPLADSRVELSHQLRDVQIVDAPATSVGLSRLLVPMAVLALGISVACLGVAWALGLVGTRLFSEPDPLKIEGDNRICGKGFEPYAVIEATLGYPIVSGHDADLFSTQVDSQGSFCGRFQFPAEAQVGRGTIEVYEVSAGITHINRLDVSVTK